MTASENPSPAELLAPFAAQGVYAETDLRTVARFVDAHNLGLGATPFYVVLRYLDHVGVEKGAAWHLLATGDLVPTGPGVLLTQDVTLDSRSRYAEIPRSTPPTADSTEEAVAAAVGPVALPDDDRDAGLDEARGLLLNLVEGLGRFCFTFDALATLAGCDATGLEQFARHGALLPSGCDFEALSTAIYWEAQMIED